MEMNTHLLWLLVQFSSSAEVSERGVPAGGLSKLSSADEGEPSTRPVVPATYGRRSGRHLENVSLERR